jgi:hypothetical protein
MKAHCGIDAPKVIRNLLIAGIAGFAGGAYHACPTK